MASSFSEPPWHIGLARKYSCNLSYDAEDVGADLKDERLARRKKSGLTNRIIDMTASSVMAALIRFHDSCPLKAGAEPPIFGAL
ncbi:hypothetical protein QR66_05465 [Chromobacterium piscinae]|nr:hypothetical protein QR66_05465 [Chromobacterium piscinae]